MTAACVIGVETFTYLNGTLANEADGIHWDFDNTTGTHTGSASDWDAASGSPTVSGESLVTDNSSAEREYNGTIEGTAPPPSDEADGAVNDSNVHKAVYYRVTCTTGATLPSSFGLISSDFGTDRVFFGMIG